METNPEKRMIEAESSESYLVRLIRELPMHLHHEAIFAITEIARVDGQQVEPMRITSRKVN